MIRVLVVDDSALMRQMLTEVLASDPEIEVVGSAGDAIIAREKVLRLRPDVLTLDVEMPRMDGLTFLAQLMRVRPMPVVMVSALTERGADATFRALELGAVDFVTKPKLDLQTRTLDIADEVIAKVKTAGRVRPLARRSAEAPAASAPVGSLAGFAHRVIALGASTGGTEALRAVVTALPADSPGCVIVQHMPEGFTASFAARLNSLSRIRVREARDGDAVEPGLALLAPGNRQMEVMVAGGVLRARVFQGERVNLHRPSVDVLFHSCAQVLGKRALAVMLTGMGSDGSKGMLAMRQAGARTIAQDEATCVVFGMPREAIALGAVERVVPIQSIAAELERMLRE